MNDIALFQNEILEFQRENLELKSQLQAWKDKYEAVLEQFKLAQQRQFDVSSEKSLLQPDFFDEAGDYLKEAEEDKEPQTIEVPAHKHLKAKRKPLPENLPREDHVIDIDENEKICACGCQKEQFSEEITEQLEVIQPQLFVTRHCLSYSCPKASHHRV